MTIVKDIVAYKDYPFDNLSLAWRRLLGDAFWELGSYANYHQAIFVTLECLLQITGEKLPPRPSVVVAEQKLLALLGAVNSPTFVCDRTQGTVSLWSRVIVAVINQLRASGEQEPLAITVSEYVEQPEIRVLRDEFERKSLDEEAVWLWKGWPVENGASSTRYLPLFSIYKRFGREFTEQLHSTCADFFKGSRYGVVPGIAQLSEFIASRPDLSLSELQKPHAGEKFWHEFWAFYQAERTASVDVMLDDWRNHIRKFFQNYLIDSGLFPPTISRFPGPEPDSTNRPGTRRLHERRKKDFDDNNSKRTSLLFGLPTAQHGDELWSFLSIECPRRVELIKRWATAAATERFARHLRRKKWARSGESDHQASTKMSWKKLTHQDNPRKYINAAYWYEKAGHIVSGEKKPDSGKKTTPSTWYPKPISRTVRELGMPTIGTLLPFATLLVLQHPNITTSFLENLEPWDDNGQLVNLNHQNGVWYLIGPKYRKGERVGEVRVKLTKETLKLVVSVISITRPLRKWLRDQGSPIAKRLMLECGRGFSTPVVASFSSHTGPQYLYSLFLDEFLACREEFTKEEVLDLLKRFSLGTLRRTVGVKIFVETRNPYITSDALGHDTYSPESFACYVPPQIAALAEELVIRDFHTVTVAHATVGSKYQLAATGFTSAEALREFLEQHAFPKLDSLSNLIRAQNQRIVKAARHKSEIVFCANLETLIPITSAAAALSSKSIPLSVEGEHIASFANAIVEMLDARIGLEPSIDELVKQAKSQANIDLVREALCE
ncbi:hypothetical protein [Burkholderia sp. PU8-34]